MPPTPVTGGTAATVTVDLGMTLATVSPDLMGIHTSVYDGKMREPTTIDALKAAGVKSLRYPGGSYGDIYHWELHKGTLVPTGDGKATEVYVDPAADMGKFVAFLTEVGANAMITVNYGTSPAGDGPGLPEEAAAWVAYANGSPSNTTAIGTDAAGPWKTVGYWAGLRAADPLPVDDGLNFLRISRPDPVGIKYWEIGNELYGNGYYYGGCGWEADLHLAYPANKMCTNRMGNASLSPAAYGGAVVRFSAAMKKVDPTVKIGVVLHWPYGEYASWNGEVLPMACAAADFGINHWYAGTTVASLLTVPKTEIPKMFSDLRLQLTMAANNCGTKGATMPLAVTEWGPNYYPDNGPIDTAFSPKPPNVTRVQTQVAGIFAAESYANFMEQGALAVHWLELHNDSYLAPTPAVDTAAWGYHGQLIAHQLADGGDTMVRATVSNAGTLATLLQAHAAIHKVGGGISVMLTNTSPTAVANVTVNLAGAGTKAFDCVGARHAYVPVPPDLDGTVTSAPIFAAAPGTSVAVAVPAYSVVVVTFPLK